MTLGWRIARVTRDSSRKRATADSSCNSSGRKNLMAARRPVKLCNASQTVLIAPSPGAARQPHSRESADPACCQSGLASLVRPRWHHAHSPGRRLDTRPEAARDFGSILSRWQLVPGNGLAASPARGPPQKPRAAMWLASLPLEPSMLRGLLPNPPFRKQVKIALKTHFDAFWLQGEVRNMPAYLQLVCQRKATKCPRRCDGPRVIGAEFASFGDASASRKDANGATETTVPG